MRISDWSSDVGSSDLRYAVETRYVREVTRFADFTTVPGAPNFVVGVTNLRGGVLVVFDLRKILGIPAPGLTDLSRVIVHGRERAEFGILADAVHEVRIISADRKSTRLNSSH